MITRDIYRDFYRDQGGPTFDQKVFLAAKRGCLGIAGVALALSILDFAGIHNLRSASAMLSDSHNSLAALGQAVRGGINDISIWRDPAVVVKIPTAPAQLAARPVEKIGPRESAALSARAEAKPSSVDKLASAASQDAVRLAMVEPAGKSSFASSLREAPQLAAFNPITAVEPGRAPYSGVPFGDVSISMEAAIPANLVPLPREAPGAPPPSPAERLGLLKEGHEKELAKAQRCLANAIYFEARSEPVRGQMAVAQVVLNRAFSGFYPNDVCAVVYQNAHRRLACQFTFACDGKSKAINERGHWSRANRIARETLNGEIYLPEVGKSTHYHAAYVHPNWVREMKRFARYGLHSFYRPLAWGNGADEPIWGQAMAKATTKVSTR